MGIEPKYKRVLMKLSGEAISGGDEGVIDFKKMSGIAEAIKLSVQGGVQIAVVFGAGNIYRGARGTVVERVTGDSMGMLATVINSLALRNALIQAGVKAVVLNSFEVGPVAEFYSRDKAVSYMENGCVVILSGGTGNPYFSTDTAAMLRAAEINADVLLMAKNVDGIYTADPNKDKNATRYDVITYQEILAKELNAIDLAAAALGISSKIATKVFRLLEPMHLYEVMFEDVPGTDIIAK
jgi:uridylate kinase